VFYVITRTHCFSRHPVFSRHPERSEGSLYFVLAFASAFAVAVAFALPVALARCRCRRLSPIILNRPVLALARP
jgi:hypothetical protein